MSIEAGDLALAGTYYPTSDERVRIARYDNVWRTVVISGDAWHVTGDIHLSMGSAMNAVPLVARYHYETHLIHPYREAAKKIREAVALLKPTGDWDGHCSDLDDIVFDLEDLAAREDARS